MLVYSMVGSWLELTALRNAVKMNHETVRGNVIYHVARVTFLREH